MVNNTRVFVRLAMIGVLVAPVASQAEPIRCGTGLIQEGATALEIREKCGEPTTVERTSTPVYELRPDGLDTRSVSCRSTTGTSTSGPGNFQCA